MIILSISQILCINTKIWGLLDINLKVASTSIYLQEN